MKPLFLVNHECILQFKETPDPRAFIFYDRNRTTISKDEQLKQSAAISS